LRSGKRQALEVVQSRHLCGAVVATMLCLQHRHKQPAGGL